MSVSSSSIALVALKQARTHLNDEQGSNWGNAKLMPKLQAAYGEMLNELVANGVPLVNTVTTVMTVPAISIDDNNVDMSTVTGYPTNMVEPLWMKERSVGQMNTDFVDMVRVDFIPNITLSNTQLVWWSWCARDSTPNAPVVIMLRGCTVNVQVQLRYRRLLSAPKTVNDDLVVTLAETFLGPETAYLALVSTPNYDPRIATSLKGLAERNLDNVIRDATKGAQNMPARRRAYHRGHGRSRAIRDF